MQILSIVGASSFIGKHLLSFLSKEYVKVSALSRIAQHHLTNEKIKFFRGDLLDAGSLTGFISTGGTVINLAYLNNNNLEENVLAIRNLLEECKQKKVKRFIHCSTVMVCGDRAPNIIDEKSACFPETDYEVTKFQIEKLILEYAEHFEIAILRPAAVFGPGGKNLLKLAHSLRYENRFKNYLKSCLLKKRKMNLVCVENVVAAITCLIQTPTIPQENIFIVSDDDDENNYYYAVEKQVIKKFYNKNFIFPRIPLPGFILSSIATMVGKKNMKPRRIYRGNNLNNLGFKKTKNLSDGINQFIDWYIS